MQFFFWRSEPRYNLGVLVAIASREGEYLLIRNRRWVRPDGETTRRWLYDGVVYRIKQSKLALTTVASISEQSVRSIL